MSEREAKSVEWAVRVQASRLAAVVYWLAFRLLRLTLMPWLRVRREGIEHLAVSGPVILAPVHRSNLDAVLVACSARRRIRAIGKESLFTHPIFAWLLAAEDTSFAASSAVGGLVEPAVSSSRAVGALPLTPAGSSSTSCSTTRSSRSVQARRRRRCLRATEMSSAGHCLGATAPSAGPPPKTRGRY